MNENEMTQDDEISLFDLWEKLRDGWKAVAGGLVLGIAGAFAGIVLIPPRYEATAVLQIGKVAGGALEAPEVAVQRIRQPAFLVAVAEAAADAPWAQRLQANPSGDKTVTPSVVKGTPLLSIVATGETADQAAKRLSLTVERLRHSHEEIGNPLVSKIKLDMEVSREKLKVAELELAELSKPATGGTGGTGGAVLRDAQFAPVALVTSLRVQKQADIFGLRQQLIAAENSLLPPATEPTRPLERIFASEKPVSPKKSLLLALGSIGGLLAGMLWVFMSDAWRRARASRAGR
jgi:hypothetical protein